ncbi:TetR/AcrR family transcriptional regulator [Marihabitans asiaticum]|uniref:TetR family transcriptional regulator n=1 Tax=Marihabitans asiaticum TaxID=415218 RepID=A0A560WGA8_9MICO|nr:TetR/AcrR family transcriptional regulator [Marihabitans asiaticum]TWD16719.1 TetR family transcriptional regulator [Marihabitans asiaticum]
MSRTLTARGERTRQRLIDAAEVVFGRQGFLETKITDITAEAGSANGSFYNYFDSKEDIFSVVISRVNERMREQLDDRLGPGATPRERIEHATGQYVRAYRTNAQMVALLEQVSSVTPEFKAARIETRRRYTARNERSIRRWQEAGLMDASLPPRYAAEALASMVSNFCYMWFTMEADFEEDLAIHTLSRMWANSLGLEGFDDEPGGGVPSGSSSAGLG